jgi:hypothetical protein
MALSTWLGYAAFALFALAGTVAFLARLNDEDVPLRQALFGPMRWRQARAGLPLYVLSAVFGLVAVLLRLLGA